MPARPCRHAQATRPGRPSTSSFDSTWFRWVFTVASLTHEAARDLLVRQPLGDQPHDVDLAPGQATEVGLGARRGRDQFDQAPLHGRVEHGASGRDVADGTDQLLAGRVLGEVADARRPAAPAGSRRRRRRSSAPVPVPRAHRERAPRSTSSPVRLGIRRSSSATSGRAVEDQLAPPRRRRRRRPTTSMSSLADSSSTSPSRTTAWSSATTTRITVMSAPRRAPASRRPGVARPSPCRRRR